MKHATSLPQQPVQADPHLFDVRPIPCRVKHGQILQRWLDLPVGGHFVLLNDHDPVPLRYQFESEFPGAFRWDYAERGPEDFRVRITKLKAVEAPERAPASPPPAAAGSPPEIDARGLMPPSGTINFRYASLDNRGQHARFEGIATVTVCTIDHLIRDRFGLFWTGFPKIWGSY